MSVFNLCSTLGRPLGARATERIGIRKTVLWTSGFVAVFTLPLAFTEQPLLLLALRGAAGAFWGVSMVAISLYQSLSIPAEKRGSAYAWVAIAYVFPQVTVFPLADWFASLESLLGYFILGTAVETVVVFTAVPLPPVRRAEGRSGFRPWGKWSELSSVPGFWAVLTAMFLFAFVNASTLQYFPTFLVMKGYSASIFIVPNALTAMGLRLLAYRIMDRIDRKTLIGPVVAAMGLVLTFLPFAPSGEWFVAGGIAYGVAMGMAFPIILALMPDIFPDHLRPKGISICFFAIDIGYILSPFFLGYGGEIFGLGTILSAAGVIGLIGGMALYCSWRKGWTF